MTRALDIPSKRLKPYPPRVQQAFENIENAVGGRDALSDILSHSNKGPEIEYIIGLLSDPLNDGMGLGYVCRLGNITIGQLLSLLKDAKIAKATQDSIDKIAAKLPGVAEHVMSRAVPYLVKCFCSGKDHNCNTCGGHGTYMKEPDIEITKVALEIGGLLKKGGGVQINNQLTQNSANFGPDLLKQFRDASDKILFGNAPTPQIESTVDAELTGLGEADV